MTGKDEDTVQMSLTGDEVDDGDDLVVSAHVAQNERVFPQVLNLHVEDGARIADVTYGKGVFWNRVPPNKYDLTATDINPEKSPDSEDGVDCRDLPYDDGALDCVVLDPPYASGFFRDDESKQPGKGTHESFHDSYTSSATSSGSKYHQAVLDLYFEAGQEAARVLGDEGTFVVKVQDEVSANTQHLTHVEITNFYEEELGFYTKDLFVVVRPNTPSVSGMDEQVHARKNHSYFMVYEA